MGKMVFAVDPLSFEYLKMGKRVGKGRGRETSDWLFASVTPTWMLALESQRPFLKLSPPREACEEVRARLGKGTKSSMG